MKKDDIYLRWKSRSTDSPASRNFVAEVMHRVHQEVDNGTRQWNWQGLLEFFQRNVAIQYAAIAVAAVAGIGRLGLIIFAILNP